MDQIAWNIRRAVPADAAQLIAFVRELLKEPGLDIPMELDEFSITIDEERQILDQYNKDEDRLFLIAVVGDKIIGEINLSQESRKAWRHIAVLGMSVRREWRNRGVGTALLEEALAWARANPRLRRVELSVYARNEVAIGLYQKYGFIREGIRSGRIMEQGEFLDDWIMALDVR